MCDFVDSSETIFREHVKSNHEYECEVCEIVVKTKHKLKNYLCRVDLKYPSYNNFYMKTGLSTKVARLVIATF